ncbi:MAG: glycosyltransferase [Chryseobacterium sp.]|nr:glycosyltransferase [Chryseobacterium sp.]
MKYSIAIPGYKGKFLFKCIESILCQDYADFELIIVNDASPDNLDDIVNQFNDSRIRYFKNEKNCGAENVVDNWNICLSYAQGDYFILMGDDDELMPNYLSTFDRLIKTFPDLNVYHCRSFIINDQSDIIRLTPSWPERESVYENIWHRMKGLRSQYISDFLYSREHLVSKGGFFKLPLAWASDDITSFEASMSKGIAHTQEPIFCYRESDTTISNSGSVDLKFKAIGEEEIWYDNFLKNMQPEKSIDFYFYQNIKAEKNKYFLTKRIETIAYSGIRERFIFRDFLFFFKNKKQYNLTFKQVIYAFILALKKSKSKNI